jgi:hypothetical protein
MLDRIVDWFMNAATAIPAILVDERSPNFTLIRVMFALILISLVVYLIATRPFRSAIGNLVQRICRMFSPGT